MGETAAEFKRRLQLEKAAHLLRYDEEESITGIALSCGFSSSQNFARAFKPAFGLTPTAYRNNSKPGNMLRNQGNDRRPRQPYPQEIHNKEAHDARAAKVTLERLPGLTLCYERLLGTYEYSAIQPLFTRLFARVRRHDLLSPGATVLGICWDDMSITGEGRQRYDACISVPTGAPIPASMDSQQLPGGRYAVYRCRITDRNFHEHWRWLLAEWLPASDLVLDDRPALEVFPDLADGTPARDYTLEIRLPLKG